MQRARYTLAVMLLLMLPALAQAAIRISLNEGWRFRTDPKEKGQALNWNSAMPAQTEAVTVPHTWNVGTNEDYEGAAWYFKTFEIPKAMLNQHLEIHFGATFYKARVWLNGVELGSHEGGHTEYFFDISSRAREVNYLAIQIDNRPGLATIPGWAMRQQPSGNIWYDWWHYGGIVRDVWLTVGGDLVVRRQQIRSRMQDGAADVSSQVYLENFSGHPKRVWLRGSVLNQDGSIAASAEQHDINLRPGKNELPVALKLLTPRLWSIDDPNTYEMQLELFDDRNKPLDSKRDSFGVRAIEIRDRHLFINGERVRLCGMARHEESPTEGLAETRGTMLRDYEDMKSLHVALSRPVHYPQNPYVLDLADRNGILLIPEIPVWQFSAKQLADPKVLTLAKQMMREMIEQAGNHPSIFAWSVCNESETATPEGREYFRKMRAFIRELDPDRFVTFADLDMPDISKAEDSASNDADFIMMNEYFGTWAGPASQFPALLDKVDHLFPNRMVVISEFGVPGVFAHNSADADQLRVNIIRSQLAEVNRRDWIAGTILWCYQDYRSHRNLWPGQVHGYVDHGLVDENRQRRSSYFVWKELNAPAEIDPEFTGPLYGIPNGFKATVKPRPSTELPSYPLHNYQLNWEVRDQNGAVVNSGARTLSSLDKVESFEANWKTTESITGLRLHITLLRPMGFLAAEKTAEWVIVKPGGQGLQQMHPNHLPY